MLDRACLTLACLALLAAVPPARAQEPPAPAPRAERTNPARLSRPVDVPAAGQTRPPVPGLSTDRPGGQAGTARPGEARAPGVRTAAIAETSAGHLTADLPTRGDIEHNLERAYLGPRPATVECGGNKVTLSSVEYVGLHPYEPVVLAGSEEAARTRVTDALERRNRVIFWRGYIYFWGTVAADQPSCAGARQFEGVALVRLAGAAGNVTSPGPWFAPSWQAVLEKRR